MFLDKVEQARGQVPRDRVAVLLVGHGQPDEWDVEWPTETEHEIALRRSILELLVDNGYERDKLDLAWMEFKEPRVAHRATELSRSGVELLLYFSAGISAESIHSQYDVPKLISNAEIPEDVTVVNLGAWNDHPLTILAIAEKVDRMVRSPHARGGRARCRVVSASGSGPEGDRDLAGRTEIVRIGSRRPPTAAGSKAAGLSWLAAHHFPIPVTWAVLAQDPPADRTSLQAALAPVVQEGVAYAVRSSADVEDGSERSFAGQFDSVLCVRGLDAVADAVQEVREGIASVRVDAYQNDAPARRSAWGCSSRRWSRATMSGVAFSANPVTGLAETIVEAVPGTGDALVQHGATPERWVFAWGKWKSKPSDADAARERGARDHARCRRDGSTLRQAGRRRVGVGRAGRHVRANPSGHHDRHGELLLEPLLARGAARHHLAAGLVGEHPDRQRRLDSFAGAVGRSDGASS